MLRSLRRHRRRRRGEKESIDCSASLAAAFSLLLRLKRTVGCGARKKAAKEEGETSGASPSLSPVAIRPSPSVPRTQLGCEGGREGLREGTDMHASAAKLWSETE